MSKTMTPAALAANRRNARKSTGPRTPQGKQRSSMNATTHGVLVRNLIPTSLQPYEDAAEFAAHAAGFYRQFAPANPMEDHLVQTIIACTWRLGRLARAEAGAIALAQERAAAANRFRADLLRAVAQDSGAIQAALDSGDMDELRRVLDPHGLYRSCDTDDGARALAADQLRRAHDETRDQSGRDPQSALDRAALPPPHQALLYARYEAHFQRQLHRALSDLRTLQRDRMNSTQADPPSPADGGPFPPSMGEGSGACAVT